MIDFIQTDGGRFFSKDYGIIHLLNERRCVNNTTNIFDIVSNIYIDNKKSINGGGNTSKKQAFFASIGEAIERYCLKSYNPNTFIKEYYKNIKIDKPKVQQLNFFLPNQLIKSKLPRFSPQDKINWVIGKSFKTMSQNAIPASLVYLPFKYTNNDPFLTIQLSPGTACHSNYEQATLIAILECIERDSFTLFWEAGIKFPLIPSIRINENLQKKDIKIEDGKIFCLDLTSDLEIPVVLTLIMNNCPPYVSIGIAASIDANKALDKSIMEAITSWRSSCEIVKNVTFNFEKIMVRLNKNPDFIAHATYHSFVDTRPYFYKLMSNGPISARFANYDNLLIEKNSFCDNLRHIQNRFANLDYDIIIVDITTEDIKDHGLSVVRAISLDLVRPSLGLIFRHLNNPRFMNVPKKLGLHSYRTTYQDILNFRMPTP